MGAHNNTSELFDDDLVVDDSIINNWEEFGISLQGIFRVVRTVGIWDHRPSLWE